MKLPRRRFLQLAASAAALPAISQAARAQTYPSRPVRWIVPYPPGGAGDILARLMAQQLSDRLGQPFVIENKPGAGTNIGTESVVHAPADGYTLLLAATPAAINATLYEKLNFNFMRDIAPVASLIGVPEVLEVNPSFPAKTVSEFIADAKAHPGKVNYASSGNGTFQHLCGELFKMMTGIDMVHVPYRGDAFALNDLIGGQVQAMFGNTAPSIEHIRTGRLRALAVTTMARLDVLPGIPTVGDFVPGYEAVGWFGLGAPSGTPTEVVDKLNKEVNTALADPKMKARLAELGYTELAGSPNEFRKLIADETEKWAKLVKFSGARPG
jgi:tripartite-type tricarboxylate transporter receptor subunit TctC